MKKKNLVKILAALFIIFLLWRIVALITKEKNDTQKLTKPPVAVLVDSVRFAAIQEINMFTGTVYPRYQYVVSPKVSGRVVVMRKRIGDRVRRGEVISRIDDAEYQQAVFEAEANLKIAEASLSEAASQFELAEQEFNRSRLLQEKGIASPAELDAAASNFTAQESRLKLARAQVEQREAALKSTNIRLAYTVLAATEPGFIGERFVDEGSLLAPNSPIVTVIGIDSVIIRTSIIERVYGRIKAGQSAEVSVDAFPDHRFWGRVARIAPMLQEASRVANIEIEVPNDSLLLKPGMFAKIDIVLAQKDSAQTVPAEALVTRGGESGVFVVDEATSTARYVPIQPGIVTKEKVEIVAPPIQGRVITLGQHLLENGSPIILPDAKKVEPNKKEAAKERQS